MGGMNSDNNGENKNKKTPKHLQQVYFTQHTHLKVLNIKHWIFEQAYLRKV